ncbi:hypothetical protein D3C78_1189880 [compost metagenome]
MLEALVGLELRVVLRHREQLAEAGAQAALGATEGTDVALLAGAGHRTARGDHRLEGGALVLHVLLAGFHQLGQLIVALAQQHVDVRPGLADPVLETHQGVVDLHRITGQQDAGHQNGDSTQTHARNSL